MGTAAKRPQAADGSPDGTEAVAPAEPTQATRSDKYYLEAERIQSGSLQDDPTESGAPVKNRKSFKALKGNR